jgi:hypothetical protein
MIRLQRDLEVVNHYARFWGKLYTVVKFNNQVNNAPKPIFGLEFTPTSPEENWIYATVGASRKVISDKNISEVKIRFELLIFSRERNHNLQETLVNLAVYPFYYGTLISPGHVIVGDRGVIPNSALTNVLFIGSDFIPQAFDVIHHKDGTQTHIFFVIPIHTSERNYLNKNGLQSLLKLFSDLHTDTADLTRPSAIPTA